MRKLNLRVVLVLGAGLVLGVIGQLLRLQRACELPQSQPCLTGQTYLPLSLLVGAIFGLALGAFVLVMFSIAFGRKGGGAARR